MELTEIIEAIVWHDAVADIGWKAGGESELPHRCTSIGLVVFDGPNHIVLASTWGAGSDGETETNNRMTIPKGWIVSRRKARIARK